MKIWLLAAAALSLASPAWAQETPAPAAAAEGAVETVAVPVEAPEPPEPPSQYGECIPSLIPAGARCRVMGLQTLGDVAGGQAGWALYSIRAPKGRSGLSVLTNPGFVGSMLVSDAAVEDWVTSPYPVAGVFKSAETEYVVMSMRGDDGPEASAAYRVDPTGWTPMDAAGLQYEVASKVHSLTGGACKIVAGGMNWRAFALRYDLMGEDGSCGAAYLNLGVENGALKVTQAMAVKPDLTPVRRSRGRRR